jgi:alpha-ketoglutarate-dependent 2,4-dichlorophenoxyacetate dioxygenase
MHSRRLVAFTAFSEEQRSALPPVSRPLVRRHPESGRPTLYLASHASHVEGWSLTEGRALLEELMALATRPPCIFRHSWRVGDLVIWDNSCTMHRGLTYDDVRERRDLRRTTTEDSAFADEAPPAGSEECHARAG